MYSVNDIRSQLRRLNVVPLSDLIPTAQVNSRDVLKIAMEMKSEGVLRHPLLTTRLEKRHLILDGNARLVAALQIGLPDILIQEIPRDILPDLLHIPAVAAMGVAPEEVLRIIEGSFVAEPSADARGLRLIIRPDDVHLMPCSEDAPFEIWETFGRMTTALKAVADVVPLPGFKWSPGHQRWPHPVSAILSPPPLPPGLLGSLARKGILLPANMLHAPVPRRILGINLSLEVLSAPEALEEKTAFVRELLRLRISERRIQYYDAPVYIVES